MKIHPMVELADSKRHVADSKSPGIKPSQLDQGAERNPHQESQRAMIFARAKFAVAVGLQEW